MSDSSTTYGLFSAGTFLFLIAIVIFLIDLVPFLWTARRGGFRTAQLESPLWICKYAVWTAFVGFFFSVFVLGQDLTNKLTTMETLSASEALVDVIILAYFFQRVFIKII